MTTTVRWLVYSFVAALAVAIIAFPAPRELFWVPQHPTSQSLRRAQVRWMTQSELLRRTHSREVARQSLSAPPAKANDAAFEFVVPPGISTPIVEGIQKVARRMLAARPDSSVRVIVALTVDTGTTLAGVYTHRAGWWSSTDVFMPGGVSPNSCVIVVRTTTKTRFDANRVDFGGKPCYWYGTYGLPGRGVASMLDSTRAKALTVHEVRFPNGRESYFEYALYGDASAQKCRAGDREMCEHMLLRSPFRYNAYDLPTPQWAGSGRYYSSGNEYLPGVLLSRIERELGRAEFARLWKSDKPFPDAFADAYGKPLGDWIHGLVVAHLNTRERGPLPPQGVWVALSMLVPGLIALGAYGASRRAAVA